jgi:hypothetical protein
MKHTPGPWTVYDDSNDGKTNRIEIAARGKTVARIYQSVPEEDLPNARLIAAAPDLLEALKMAVSALERSDYIQMDGDSFDVVDVSRAAIARASGE